MFVCLAVKVTLLDSFFRCNHDKERKDNGGQY